MPSVINTNIASLNTQRNLNTSQATLNTSIQRLSSGLRVNSAKDDAAGLAIAERMNAQVRGLNVAARNANDGISLAQTAEGAFGKVGEMVQRLRELAVQSSNATNTAEDRAALQKEVAQLKEEIDRVATTTNFNGKKLLNGEFDAQKFQVGADAGQSISIEKIASAQLTEMGEITQRSTTIATNTITAGQGTATSAVAGDTALAAVTGAFVVTIGDRTVNIDLAEVAVDTSDGGDNQVAARTEQIRAAFEAAGLEATIDASGDVELVAYEDFTATAGSATSAVTTTTVGAAASAASTVTETPMAMDELDISDYEGSQIAIRMADAALKMINESRAELGALQSRFESAVSNIQIAAENTTAARSRIMDTDFASETAALTRAQILQQAGNAMLSQANQLPQQVLNLLK